MRKKIFKTKYLLFTLIILVIVSTPFFVQARGLVPCGGEGESLCNICFLFKLLENVMSFLVNMVGIIATLFLVVGGIVLVVSGANKGLYETGKKIVTNTIIGTAIVIMAWIGINTILTIAGFTRANIGLSGNWFELQCSTTSGTTDGGGGTGTPPPEGENTPASCTPCDESIVPSCENKVQTAGFDPYFIRTIMKAETHKDKITARDVTAKGDEGAGHYSCGLMQIYDDNLKALTGKNCDEVLNQTGALITIQAAASLLGEAQQNAQRKIGQYASNPDLTLVSMTAARYNDGAIANNPSVDCNRTVPKWYCETNIGELRITKNYALGAKRDYEYYKNCQ